MLSQIADALKLTLVPDSESIKTATSALNALANNQGIFYSNLGYCFTLMQIVDDSN